HLQPGSWVYSLVYVGLIIFFCYFYTAVTFNPADVADNMKKFGGYIPGIRPGARTAEYIDRILTRVTLPGALYVAAVCVLPTVLITQFKVPFFFGGTALLIVVGVALDTVAAIETHMITRSYEGFMKRGRIRGRRGRGAGAASADGEAGSCEGGAGGRVCPSCGTMFHVEFHPPSTPGTCDRCGTALVQREDDGDETIGRRLDVYARETAPVLEHYRRAGLLREVDGTGSRDEVFAR